eukprot:6186635-Pleurochrysis_carterae.AAC.2
MKIAENTSSPSCATASSAQLLSATQSLPFLALSGHHVRGVRIIVGSDRLPSGLTVALKTMRKGETALVRMARHASACLTCHGDGDGDGDDDV